MAAPSSRTVRSDDGETWDVECDCGAWRSIGWPTRSSADERRAQHKTEHETGKPMPELKDA